LNQKASTVQERGGGTFETGRHTFNRYNIVNERDLSGAGHQLLPEFGRS
jgi:hypothetical protein